MSLLLVIDHLSLETLFSIAIGHLHESVTFTIAPHSAEKLSADSKKLDPFLIEFRFLKHSLLKAAIFALNEAQTVGLS